MKTQRGIDYSSHEIGKSLSIHFFSTKERDSVRENKNKRLPVWGVFYCRSRRHTHYTASDLHFVTFLTNNNRSFRSSGTSNTRKLKVENKKKTHISWNQPAAAAAVSDTWNYQNKRNCRVYISAKTFTLDEESPETIPPSAMCIHA